VKVAAKLSFCNRACAGVSGFFKSRVVLAIVLAVAVPVVLFLLVSNPFGWAVSSVIVAKAILTAIAAVSAGVYLGKNKKANFELTAVARMMPRMTNLHEIAMPGWKNTTGHKLYLGALPNKLHLSKVEKALGENGSVLSINEPWETEPVGLARPLKEKEWEGIGVRYKQIEVEDHTLVSPKKLDEAADYIHEQLKTGDVFVHCRGGVGRSATAVAAYLMKHTTMPIDEIVVGIMNSRSKATIWDKIGALRRYDKMLFDKFIFSERKNRLARSFSINAIADILDKQGKRPKICKLPKEAKNEVKGHIELIKETVAGITPKEEI
jgi:hypothetical protein